MEGSLGVVAIGEERSVKPHALAFGLAGGRRTGFILGELFLKGGDEHLEIEQHQVWLSTDIEKAQTAIFSGGDMSTSLSWESPAIHGRYSKIRWSWISAGV